MILSVIVPAYNEEKTIIAVLKTLKQISFDEVLRGQGLIQDSVKLEVIVVNDGSTDNTRTLLEANPELYAKCEHLPVNQGKGAAVRKALTMATGDYVVFQDADLEYDPTEFYQMILPVLKFNADAVIGSRMLAPRWTRVHYFWNKVGNTFITLLFNVLYNMTFTDIYSCYLMYRRNLVRPEELQADGFSQHAEILCHSIRRGKVFYEVPICYHGRTVAEGKKIRAHHIFGVIGQILKNRWV